ncbi:NUDIX domain-containing protein [Solibacillus sp. FSL W7-1464]|uniref:NUDIX hydrolase n=1 Tax=Solibacillus sp. FSL W7-1464 TaxID=2921706 RepID=UPI0030F61957
MNEYLKVFDQYYKQTGIEQRDFIHANGYWHEVFHCWIIERTDSEWRIYLQLRSKNKKDYPNQFDITAAGHILASETVEDGVRELEEEVGINVRFSQLISLGVIPYSIDNEKIKDYEFANVFIYELRGGIEQFTLQREELDGIYSVDLNQFILLATSKIKKIEVSGYKYINEKRHYETKQIGLEQMSTLPESYLLEFIPRMKQKLIEAT